MTSGFAAFTLGVLVVTGLFGQSAPAFDVASVKLNRSGESMSTFSYGPGRFTARNTTLRLLIRSAFDIQDQQLLDAPGWIASDRFDVAGTFAGDPPLADRQAMLRALLMDRFKLAVRSESRELPTYALVRFRPNATIASGLRPSTCAEDQTSAPLPTSPLGPAPCGMLLSGPGTLTGRNVTLDRLANVVTQAVRRITRNRTELSGKFDLELKWAADDSDSPSIFTALQEQLGLKLDNAREVMPVVIVERVEHPAEN